MSKPRVIMIMFVILGLFLWGANFYYPHTYVEKGYMSFFALAAIFFLADMIDKVVGKKIKNMKTRYAFQKAIGILQIIFSLMIVLHIWIENPRELLVSYGLIGAAATFALRDYIKNLAGGLTLVFSNLYSVGDRIEIEGKDGDVIDINPLYTTIMEIKEWVSGDQPTGRLTMIPNGFVLTSPVNNYTKDHEFIWDEIQLPIRYGSDWKKAQKLIKKTVKDKTKDLYPMVDKGVSTLKEKYFYMSKDLEPTIYIELTDNWINLHIRFVTNARSRRKFKSKISTAILKRVEKEKNITIASETLEIIK